MSGPNVSTDLRDSIAFVAGLLYLGAREITAGPVVVSDADFSLVVNQTVAGPLSIPLPAASGLSAVPGSRRLRIFDGKGDAGTNNITITGTGAQIDGAASVVIATDYGFVDLEWRGTFWTVLNKVGAVAGGGGYAWNPRAATNSNTTLSGPQTVDGISAAAGDLVWLFGQTTGTENGPWFVRSGAWERPPQSVAPGQLVMVGQGFVWGGQTLQVTGYGAVGYNAATVQVPTGIKVGPKSQRQGTATLVAGVATISSISVDGTSVIMLTRKTVGGTAIGDLAAPAADRTNGILTGQFRIRAYKADGTAETNDTSTVDWLIVS